MLFSSSFWVPGCAMALSRSIASIATSTRGKDASQVSSCLILRLTSIF